jgi:hypothetical protein
MHPFDIGCACMHVETCRVQHIEAWFSRAMQGTKEAVSLFFDPTTSRALTGKQWRVKFGDLCEEACGKRMAPNLTR